MDKQRWPAPARAAAKESTESTKDGSGSKGAQASSRAAKSNQRSYGSLKLPSTDQEFVFKSIEEAPGWVDRGWAGFDRGPALQLPAGDPYGTGPYHTVTARVGDKVVFTAGKGASLPKFTVIPADHSMDEGVGTRRMPQVTNASLEDQLKTGFMSPDELGSDAKAQVAQRSPGLREMVESGEGAPDTQDVSKVVKT